MYISDESPWTSLFSSLVVGCIFAGTYAAGQRKGQETLLAQQAENARDEEIRRLRMELEQLKSNT